MHILKVNNINTIGFLYGVTKKYQESSHIVEKVFLIDSFFMTNLTILAFLFNSRIIAFLASNFYIFLNFKLNILMLIR